MAEQRSSNPILAGQFADCTTADLCAWKVLTMASAEIGVQAGTFFEIDETGAALRVSNTFGLLPWRVAKGKFPFSRGICGWVAKNRQPAMVNDVRSDARFNNQVDVMTQFKTHSVICVPVSSANRLFGVLELVNRTGAPFTPSDLSRLKTFADAAASRLLQLAA